MPRRRATINPEPPEEISEDDALAALIRLSADLKKGARELTTGQARYVVDSYYQVQQFRMEAKNQVRAAESTGEPVAFLNWMSSLTKKLEGTIKSALDEYTNTLPYGRWAKSITGIGPVLSAGLAAHLTPGIASGQTTTAGKVWRFAGLDPTVTWNRHERRPWNAALKTLCWKIGESFVKVQNHEEDIYGKIYASRKELEKARNAAGQFREQAERILATKNFRKDTIARAAYETGRLPDAHIHARAKRYAVKLFLAHYFEVAWESLQHTPPPKPYVIQHLGHVDYMRPPKWPMAPGA
jgi:hypothetical protein